MSFGLLRRLRDGGGNHRSEPQPVVPPFDHPYRPVPHLFVAHHAVAQQQVVPPAATLPEQAPEVSTEHARPEQAWPDQTWPDRRFVEPEPLPAPRSGMRPAEALAELSALSRG